MKHNLIAVNNKKLENLLHSIGLLLPKENTNISSNYNVSQKNENVNKKLEDLLRPIGLLLPVGHTSSSSKNNISQMIKNVNSYDESIACNTDSIKYSFSILQI